MRVIAVDCGGSNVRTAAADDTGVLGRIAKAGTPDDLGDLAAVIAGLVGDPYPATALGVGVAGLVDVASRTLRWMPHRPGHDIPLGAQLEGRLGLPVVVDNDANLAALAEATRGAGVGHRMVLVVTVGTGIGGGLVIDGRIERGRCHLGEIGHMTVDPAGPQCACGRRGCWEALASGTALDRAARRLAVSDPRGALAGVAATEDVDGATLVAMASAGDRSAREALDAAAGALGRGLASLVAILDPDVIVVGGGVGAIGEAILEPARRAMMAATPGREHRRDTPLVAARFGVDAGLVGAALAAGGGA